MAPSESSSRTAGDRSEPLAYLFGLAPGVVVLVVGPWLAALGPATLTVAVSLAVRAAGVVLLVAGLAVAAWAVHSFARAGEPPSPVGTPERLVTDGALAYSRNPIYLGTVAGVAGEAVAFGSLAVGVYAVALWLVYHLLVVYREEAALAAAFGAEYERYRESVPRWV